MILGIKMRIPAYGSWSCMPKNPWFQFSKPQNCIMCKRSKNCVHFELKRLHSEWQRGTNTCFPMQNGQGVLKFTSVSTGEVKIIKSHELRSQTICRDKIWFSITSKAPSIFTFKVPALNKQVCISLSVSKLVYSFYRTGCVISFIYVGFWKYFPVKAKHWKKSTLKRGDL